MSAGKTRITTVVGARPQFVKAAVLSRLVRDPAEGFSAHFEERLIHTGQHHDANMSAVFFEEMGIPEPDANLGISGGSHGRMTGDMLAAIEADLVAHRPDLLLVYGDTNSTIAAALAAAKLHVPVAHVEAGLRSWDRKMPEEINRVLTDHASSWLFCPTDDAVANLAAEGVTDGARGQGARVVRTGDIMYDASLYYQSRLAADPGRSGALARLGLESGSFVLLTMHRAENTDDPDRLAAILDALTSRRDMRIVFPVHPRTRKAMESRGIYAGAPIIAVEPLGYLDMLELEAACSFVVTDSGGVQKEAYFFRKPCVTLRDSTEWTETLRAGANVLVGADPSKIAAALAAPPVPPLWPELYGKGDTGRKILEALRG